MKMITFSYVVHFMYYFESNEIFSAKYHIKLKFEHNYCNINQKNMFLSYSAIVARNPDI